MPTEDLWTCFEQNLRPVGLASIATSRLLNQCSPSKARQHSKCNSKCSQLKKWMDEPEFQTGPVFCLFCACWHKLRPFQHVQVSEIAGDCRCIGAWKTHDVPLFVIVGDAGKDSCPKKSKAESGSRLWIPQVDNKQLLADQAWRFCGFMKAVPLKLASLCSEAFSKRTLKERSFQGLYLWEADWSTSYCSRKQLKWIWKASLRRQTNSSRFTAGCLLDLFFERYAFSDLTWCVTLFVGEAWQEDPKIASNGGKWNQIVSKLQDSWRLQVLDLHCSDRALCKGMEQHFLPRLNREDCDNVAHVVLWARFALCPPS